MYMALSLQNLSFFQVPQEMSCLKNNQNRQFYSCYPKYIFFNKSPPFRIQTIEQSEMFLIVAQRRGRAIYVISLFISGELNLGILSFFQLP